MASRRTWIALLVLLVLTGAAYAPVLRGGFIWGDEGVIREAVATAGAGWGRLWLPPLMALQPLPGGSQASDGTVTAAYAPLPMSLMWVQHAIWGNAAAGYHAVSVGLHLAAAWLLWLVLRRLGLQWGALLGAALFAVHPMHVEAVAWIARQGEVLGLVMALLAVLAWQAWLGRRPHGLAPEGAAGRVLAIAPRSPVGTAGAYAAAFVFAALAFFSGPLTLVLPVGMLLVAWLRHGRLLGRTLLGALPFVVLAGAFLTVALLHAQRGEPLLTASQVTVASLAHLLVPARLAWMPSQPVVGPGTWACWAALLGAVGITLSLKERLSRIPAMGVLFFVAALLLAVVTLRATDVQFAADRLAYIASIGVLAVAAMGVVMWVRRHPRRATPILATALGVVLGLTAMSARRSWVFADAERLYRDTLARQPRTALAAESLAELLLVRHGEAAREEATALYLTAMEAEPARTSAARAYARMLAAQGHSRQAQDVLIKALAVRPTDALANEALGDLVVASVGRAAYPRVLKYYEQAFAAAPERRSAAASLARVYVALSRPADAAAVLEKALQHHPRDIAWRMEAAALNTQLKAFDRADLHFEVASALDPENAEICGKWGDALLAWGHPLEAEKQFRKALQAAPLSMEHRLGLGRALRDQGKLGSALGEFQTAQELDETRAAPFVEAAQVYLKLREEQKAEEHLRIALRLEPKFTAAQVALARLYLTSLDTQRRNVWRGITLLRDAVAGTHGEDLSVLVSYAIALGQAQEYDQALEAMERAIALGRRSGLPGEDLELLIRSKSQLEVASAAQLAPAAAPPTAADGDSRISLMGTGLEYDPEPPLPVPQQRPVADVFRHPLDLSRPPRPEEIWMPPLPAGPRSFSPMVLPPPQDAPGTQPRPPRTGLSR